MCDKLQSANYLVEGMKVLKGPLLAAKVGAQGSNAFQQQIDQNRIGKALTCVVLYATVVELILKHLWEQEHGGTAPFTHDIHKIFSDLDARTQRDIEKLYDQCCLGYKEDIRQSNQQLGDQGMAMASLEEALRWNRKAMRDLKYDMIPQGRCVPAGLLWNAERMWVLPSHSQNFAIELTSQVADNRIRAVIT